MNPKQVFWFSPLSDKHMVKCPSHVTGIWLDSGEVNTFQNVLSSVKKLHQSFTCLITIGIYGALAQKDLIFDQLFERSLDGSDASYARAAFITSARE